MSTSKLAARQWQAGPEYLGGPSFLLTLAAALLLHLGGLVVWEIMPHTRVIDIPVRTLSIKLGDDDTLPDALKSIQPIAVNSSEVEDTISRMVYDQDQANQAREQAVTHSMDKAMSRPDKDAAPKAMDKAFAGMMVAPKQYVRDRGTHVVKNPGSTAGNSSKKDAEMMSRYEQLISLWIQKFKIYPPEARAQGMHGDTVVRIRIDRQGNIRYYILEHSTGYQPLDRAAIDMIRRANPVPAVPNDYPSGDLMEFLIPVSFTIE